MRQFVFHLGLLVGFSVTAVSIGDANAQRSEQTPPHYTEQPQRAQRIAEPVQLPVTARLFVERREAGPRIPRRGP